MMLRFLYWVVRFLQPPRIIRDDGEPYLSRYYLSERPTMPDGSDPFDSNGNLRLGAISNRKGLGRFIHHFHRGDNARELHNHPWRWSVSLILAGGYVEERRHGDVVKTRRLRAGSFNFIWGSTFHRVDITGDTWTLFLIGPKNDDWGFWDRSTGVYTPHREYRGGVT
jgi:hypothetical protein